MSSNPARPTGESNPVAWPQPEARHRPWFTVALVHHVRGDSTRKHSKEAAAAGLERKLAHTGIDSAEVPRVLISTVILVLSPACGSKNLCHHVEDPVHRLYI